MSVELEEFEPGRWRVKRHRHEKQRSKNMPLPFVISDTMEPTEQVDGKFYTSKRAFRAVGRANGLVEVGTEKLTRKRVRTSSTRAAAESRRTSIKKALEQFKAGAVRTPRP
jgi:hypothetical protein